MVYLRLFWIFLRVSVISEFQYRVNFFVQLFQSALALGTGLVAMSLVFSYTQNLAGWTQPELLAVMGVHIIVGGLIKTVIQPNMNRLIEDIQEGTLDFALTKPADAQAIISVREFRIWQLIDLVLGSVVLGYAISQLSTSLGWLSALAFAAAVLLGGLMIYSVWLMLSVGAFWIIRADNFLEIFDSLYQAGRWPVSIYPGWLKHTLTFVLPIAFAVTLPAETLARQLNGQNLLFALGLTVLLLVVSRLFWRFGLRHYTGASA
ncbi:ABC transporter permease [Herpetosiphon geysericola]|uniref:ABC transporter permease n=1 Tax=Herpetosiphon geysericola TaxID=70996 RepID=A0A0P6YHP9_9CHLR|nr:ABC-2 family transporter protein [Herpetosiphon geysericola]KPL88993.1 ABC transporter permease [Herpetosiphon geysericola]